LSLRAFSSWLLCLTLVVISGIQVAFSTHDVRRMHIALQAVQTRQDEALAEYSRLQLELATAAAYQNVERTAEEKLDMAFPTEVQRVEP
jgi:cell division protein FtsL